MSRIGKKPVIIPDGVKVEKKGSNVFVEGPLGRLQMACHPKIKVKIQDSKIILENPTPQNRQARELHGTVRATIANMITGVSKGFKRTLQIFGTGYSIKAQDEKLVFQIGFSHPVVLKIPEGIKVDIEIPATKGNEVPAVFTIFSLDKCSLGQFAADIRKLKPPEPYQGKGIRYADERIRRKLGKAFTSGTV